MGRSEETNVTEVDDFLADILPRQIEAERALHEGDPTPRMAMWSTDDPVTLLGAFGVAKSGWDEVIAAGASGNLAYTVGYERHAVSIGGSVERHTLRVTHVYRREHGEWKVV